MDNLPEDRLIGAVLLQLVKDWSKGRNRVDIQAFFQTPNFEEYASALGLDPVRVRAQLQNGNYDRSVAIRAAYR